MSESTRYQQLLEQEKTFHRASNSIDDMPSCTHYFDKWAMCFALVPQIRNIYRFGETNACKQKLDDFKFCLTLKGISKEEKYEAWIDRKAEKSAIQRSSSQTSETVWQARTSFQQSSNDNDDNKTSPGIIV